MYLSKLTLNPTNKRVQKELANVYELHRTIMSAFPDNIENKRVLFRLYADSKSGFPSVLVQSMNEPVWSKLNVDENYLFSNVEMKEILLKLKEGQVFYFRLYANPTVKRNGKRFGLIKDSEQTEWLQRKADNGGFSILHTSITPKGIVKQKKGKMDISFLAVTFEGNLKIDSPEKFQNTIEKGIGTGKGLGFGLLSVAPCRD